MIDSPIFYATTVHLDHIVTALNCLTPFGVKGEMLITIDKNGLSFAQENNHVIKIQLVLSRELFQTFHYSPITETSLTKVSLRLDHVLDSLNISNDRNDIIECTLTYNGDGSPFILIFEDNMITESVEYSTYLLKDLDNTGLVLDRTRLQFECIIKGDVLHNALHDLKEIGCKDCYFYAIHNETTKKPLFALISRSQQGLSKIILPNERSILEKFEIYANDSTTLLYDHPMISVFDYGMLDKIRASARIASKIMIRRDVHGLMTVNILNETKDILRPNDQEYKRTRAISGNNLPSHYPGIIIEICMLEKALPELPDVNEIKVMMIEYMGSESRHNFLPNTQQPPKKTAHDDKEEENSDGYEAASQDLPLFF
ncbi:Rad17p [Kluyveromyces lactis]|uniref:DNA damage checkpoint control protein RAD17 n=1 Tax=Kluyveromyces lactis (strain ATCC 8585 / CBS 2359 / DSM 70799 / NBRC 1267 / NRRL Y-1140 / WM37) TaxID=284590 RepID=Q6CLU5_KLULA|nr:uncharacterized protein KLLA0_F00330g [Kluyveromyces lactis]CAG97801.1 KLLA0F00330p [Kluyveromyces lactis]|eukprot:XP_455094.1 uncharacterized protein KLLA0_F00330g [Kluyveromyces lactis]